MSENSAILRPLATSPQALQDSFNRNAHRLRFLALLSPT